MITPWWRILQLRDEVGENAGNVDDVQMSLFRAVYGEPPAPYGNPSYYGKITHPTTNLAGLMSRIAIRLGGGGRYTSVPALYHLDQGMGGGKSHGLIGLYHLGNDPVAFRRTDIGEEVWSEAKARLDGVEPDLAGTRVVVISADHMTPFAPDKRTERDGPAESLWERFLWRLFDRDFTLYDTYRGRWDKDAIAAALAAAGRPVLTLVDEIMDYVRQLDDRRYEGQRQGELAFLKALLDAVNDVPHVAMVVVMIATDKDVTSYGEQALRMRDEILANLTRNGTNTAVTEAGDFAQIIRRRLFEDAPTQRQVDDLVACFADTSAQWKAVLGRLPHHDAASFPAAVARSYPFHPDLLRLIEAEWAPFTGFQRVRSTVTLFAHTAYLWTRRAAEGQWVPPLIGPGDLPLEYAGVRESLLDSGIIANTATVQGYRQVIANDIVGEGGRGGMAAGIDRDLAKTESWAATNPRAAQRMATALLLYSLAPRPGGRFGATDAEIRAASFVLERTYAATDAETVFNALRDPDGGLGSLEFTAGTGGQPPRYQLTTRQTLHMLVRTQRAAVADQDRDATIADTAERLLQKGTGFAKKRFIRDEADARGAAQPDAELLGDIDEKDATRLVALDPGRWTLLNGRDDETRRAITMAFGVGPEALPVSHAASLVLVCVNTQRRLQARQRATEYLAWSRVAITEAVTQDERLKAEAETRVSQARLAMEKEVRRAFQHYCYLVRDASNALTVRFDKFEEDTKTALSGAHVWDAIVERGRAVRPEGLNAEGLILAIKDELPLSLTEVKRLFWTNPRMPMLSSESELKRAIFDAIRAEQIELVTAEGLTGVVLDRAVDVPIGSSSITVRIPAPIEKPDVVGHDETDDGERGGSAGGGVREDKGGYDGDDNGRPAGGDGGKNKTIARGQLWLKVQADLADETGRDRMRLLLKRLESIIDDEDLEGGVLTLELVGNKDRLSETISLAKPMTSSSPRLDDLPD